MIFNKQLEEWAQQSYQHKCARTLAWLGSRKNLLEQRQVTLEALSNASVREVTMIMESVKEYDYILCHFDNILPLSKEYERLWELTHQETFPDVELVIET